MHFFCSNSLIYVFMWRSKEKSLQVTRTRYDGPETLTLLNNELNSFTLRYVFGTTPFFPAAFSASHQPSSLKCTRNDKISIKSEIHYRAKVAIQKVFANPKSLVLWRPSLNYHPINSGMRIRRVNNYETVIQLTKQIQIRTARAKLLLRYSHKMLVIYRAYILYISNFTQNALFIDPWSNPQTLM